MKKILKTLADSKKSRTFAPVKRKGHGSVAQLNRASDYGSEGYRFESCRSHQNRHSRYLGCRFSFICSEFAPKLGKLKLSIKETLGSADYNSDDNFCIFDIGLVTVNEDFLPISRKNREEVIRMIVKELCETREAFPTWTRV